MSFNIHEHNKNQIEPKCDTYTVHINKANKARNLYKEQAKQESNDKNIYADLQKIIMLP